MRQVTDADSDGRAAPPGVFLGYRSQRPWLWLVDLAERRYDPASTRLPGNGIAVSRVDLRAGWIAVHTHQTAWSVPTTLDSPGRRLCRSFRFAPRLDGETVWVQSPEDQPNGAIYAIDGHGAITDRTTLPSGSRLEAEVFAGLIVVDSDEGMALHDHDGGRRDYGQIAWFHGANSNHWLWTSRDQPSKLFISRTDGADVAVDAPQVLEWHHRGTFSPDGSYVAIGGYVEPRRDLLGLVQGQRTTRRSVMVVADVATGTTTIAGTYEDFAWTPAWLADGQWVVFNAPFDRRCLFGVQPGSPELHRWRFRQAPPAPMLDVARIGAVSPTPP
jgi:hypothetical protein